MSLYSLALFVHVISDIGLFIGVGIWTYGLIALRRTERTEQVRPIVGLMHMVERTYSVIGPLLLLSGAYLTETAWSWSTGWIVAALGTLVLILPLGPALVGRRMKAIARAAEEAPDGPLPESLAASVRDPLLGTAQQAVTGALIGVIFLMTVKPDLGTSILVVGIGLALGAATGLPQWITARRRGLTKTAQPGAGHE